MGDGRKKEGQAKFIELCLLLRFPSARVCCKNHCTNLYVPIYALLLCDLVNVAPLRLPNHTATDHKFDRTSWYKHFCNPLSCVLTKFIAKGLILKCSQQVDLRAHSEVSANLSGRPTPPHTHFLTSAVQENFLIPFNSLLFPNIL